ncbi:CDK5 regulatory subunit-associated protein 3 [Halotydeus destructor]|nr:CDK5 regulatory subunit-associated protein 3 [Halotydeus destructor]
MDEQSMPIDIQLNKLVDWLISRRHCSKDWMQKITDVRQKIKKAIADMPESEEIAKLLSKSQLNYHSCKRIVEILKETEADTKNMFGFYSSQRMKDWQEIVKMYEKDNVYLIETAQSLIRNVSYEIPSLRKLAAKQKAYAEECRRKQADYAKRSASFKAEYLSAASSLGIPGDDVRSELLELLTDFPKFANEVVADVSKLKPTCEFYQAFLSFITSGEVDSSSPTLVYLFEKGNTTFYEFSKGEKPEVVEDFKLDAVLSDSEAAASQEDNIDFGDDGDGIDFGEGTASSGSASGSNGDFVHIDRTDLEIPDANVEEISWDAGPETTVVETSNNSKIARGQDAYSLVEHSHTRSLIINELAELEGFLSQRLTEMQQESDFLSASHFQSAPALIQLTNADAITQMLADVKKVLAYLTSDKMTLLYLLKDSPNYIDSAVQKFKRKTDLEKSFAFKSKEFEEKEAEYSKETKTLRSRVQPLISQSRAIQSQIEADISKKYNGRPVNIMGGA